MSLEATQHLSRSDRKLGKLIQALGPCTFFPKTYQSPFAALVEAIVYQQLSTKAASTIFSRFKALYPSRRFPSPSMVLSTETAKLRAVGLSSAKLASIQDLAIKTIAGVVPSHKVIQKMTDAEIMDSLLTVRGVGPWTVEMFMIFKLGREDILPATDYGIRKAFAKVFNQGDLPTPKELSEYGARWKPFRTTAAWYLWKSLEESE